VNANEDDDAQQQACESKRVSGVELRNPRRTREQLLHRAHQDVHAHGLGYIRRICACARHGFVTAIAQVRDAALFQPRAHSGAIAVSQSMVHDGTGEPIVLNQWRTVVVMVAFAPALSRACTISIAMRNSFSTTRIERPRSAGCSMSNRCAAKRKCRPGRSSCGRPQCPGASINPQCATSVMTDWQKAMTAELGRARCCVSGSSALFYRHWNASEKYLPFVLALA
jgi:hypothetical protein